MELGITLSSKNVSNNYKMGLDTSVKNSSTNLVHQRQKQKQQDQNDKPNILADQSEISTDHQNENKTTSSTTTTTTHDNELTKLKEIGAKTPILPSQIGTDFTFKRKIVWFNAIGFLILHLIALYGIVITFMGIPSLKTTAYSLLVTYWAGMGVTMGAHRLWSHRSYKAKRPLKLLLLWLHTLSGQNCLYIWVRDHRQHHKYSDTDADPHNANRGFFFSHVGWLMSRKHPKVIEYGKKIDMSDLEADPYIMFQKEHYKVLYVIFALILPVSVPIYFWNEDPLIAFITCYFCRTIIQLNATWLVNSAAHLYGTRPFDKTIFPVESVFVAFFSVGEGWHNYHHAFPWDYRAAELGSRYNLTGHLIDFFAKIGQVYDRKEASHNMVKNRVLRIGDDTHAVYGSDEGRSHFKTLFNIWKHPSNPTYTSTFTPNSYKNDNHHSHSHHHHHHHHHEEQEDHHEIDNNSSSQINKYIVEKTDAKTINVANTTSNINSNTSNHNNSNNSSSSSNSTNNNSLIGKFKKFINDDNIPSTNNNNNNNHTNNNNNNNLLSMLSATNDKNEIKMNVDDVLLVKL